jgi:hypothetical protein
MRLPDELSPHRAQAMRELTGDRATRLPVLEPSFGALDHAAPIAPAPIARPASPKHDAGYGSERPS